MRIHGVIVGLILIGWTSGYARLPIEGFIPNQGLYPDTVLFWSRLPDAQLWITANGLLFDYYSIDSTSTTGAVVFLHFPIDLPIVTPQAPLPLHWTVIRGSRQYRCQPYSALWFQNELGTTQLHLWIAQGQLHYEWLGEIPSVDSLVTVEPALASSVWLDPVVRSTFFGGSGGDAIADGTVLPNGNIVVVGTTSSPDLPSHRGSYDTSLALPTDAFPLLPCYPPRCACWR